MLPQAQVVHRTNQRVRIKIEERRADWGYFETVRQKLETLRSLEYVQVNPHAASVLIVGDGTALDNIASYAREEELFDLAKKAEAPVPMAQKIITPFLDVNRKMQSITGGEAGLGEAIFTGLVGVGIYQALRGRLQFPPWYTAFWYAFGIFTKSLMEKRNNGSVS